MGATEIVALALGIVKELAGIAAVLLGGGVTGKKPEEVRDSLHRLIDRHLEPWIPQAVKAADDLFNQPGKP